MLLVIEKTAEKIHHEQNEIREHRSYFKTLTATNKYVTLLAVIVPALLLGWHGARLGFVRRGVKQLPRLLTIAAFEALRSQLLSKITKILSKKALTSRH